LASQAWSNFLANLREATTLIRADPASEYAQRKAQALGVGPPTVDAALTSAVTQGCVMLLSGRLQGCISSQLEEFLERIDQSGVVVDVIPETLRAQLCRLYHGRPGRLTEQETKQVHEAYAVLWTPGATLPAGTLKTDSISDDSNPWPDVVQGFMKRCDIDLYTEIETLHGAPYLANVKLYVGQLMEFRNAVAHGDAPPYNWTPGDMRLRMRWATRLARACDRALDAQLLTVTGAGF
jgi:hypothetical protein